MICHKNNNNYNICRYSFTNQTQGVSNSSKKYHKINTLLANKNS